jgi:hypothetical protein
MPDRDLRDADLPRGHPAGPGLGSAVSIGVSVGMGLPRLPGGRRRWCLPVHHGYRYGYPGYPYRLPCAPLPVCVSLWLRAGHRIPTTIPTVACGSGDAAADGIRRRIPRRWSTTSTARSSVSTWRPANTTQLFLRSSASAPEAVLQPGKTSRVKLAMQPLRPGRQSQSGRPRSRCRRPRIPRARRRATAATPRPPPAGVSLDDRRDRDRALRSQPGNAVDVAPTPAPAAPVGDSDFGGLAARAAGLGNVTVDGERWDGPEGSERLVRSRPGRTSSKSRGRLPPLHD